jgi:hypothetical protein
MQLIRLTIVALLAGRPLRAMSIWSLLLAHSWLKWLPPLQQQQQDQNQDQGQELARTHTIVIGSSGSFYKY